MFVANLNVCTIYLHISVPNFYFHFSCPARLKADISTVDFTPYPCLVTFKGSHNHSLLSAAILGELKMSASTKEEFFSYFEQGKKNKIMLLILLLLNDEAQLQKF